MKERKSTYINYLLEQLAEEAVPSGEIHLWPAIQSSVEASTRQSPKGSTSLHTTRRKPVRRVLTALVMAALIILAILFITPQGRSLAQNILHFFTRSNSNSLPLVTPMRVTLVDVTLGVPPATLTPTPGKPLPFASQCGDLSFPTCSLEQIRSLVQFTVKAINDVPVPSGLTFIGATGGPDQVWLVYRSEDKTRTVFLIEGTKVEQGFQGFKIAADTNVESVQVGDEGGEYVKGAWGGRSGSGNLTWDSSQPVQYLRWTAGGNYYEINAFSNPDNNSYWSIKNGLLSMARGLTTTLATPTPEPITDRLSIAEAEAQAGFHVLVPELNLLARGEYTFSHASYSPLSKTVCLVYKHPDDYGYSLSIAERAKSTISPTLNDLIPVDPKYAQYVNSSSIKIGGNMSNLGGWGLLVKGNLDPNHFCISKAGTPGGDYSPENQVLQFQTQDLQISIYAKDSPSIFERNFVTQLELVRLAESITGVHTIPDNQLDPEYLLNVQDAETLAGFHILLPTQLFPGETLSYLKLTTEGLSRSVTAMYKHNLAVTETMWPTETLESYMQIEKPEIFKTVSVRGQPALLIAEGGNSISIIWFENGIECQVYGVYDGQPVDVWLAVAESLK